MMPRNAATPRNAGRAGARLDRRGDRRGHPAGPHRDDLLRDPDNQYRRGRSYGRADNPTYDQPQALLTALEGGAASLLFSSGMAAATAVFQSPAAWRSCRRAASHVLGAARLARRDFATEWGVAVEFVDATSLDALRQAVMPGRTRLIWIETPANPLWSITDIAGAAEIAHAAGAMLAVDSTAATPVLTRPLGARRRSRHAFGDQIPERP